MLEGIQITEYDRYLFGRGTHYLIYDKLGAHPVDGGVFFAVWAPCAVGVSVVGDFNGWDICAHPMERIEDSGIFRLYIPELKAGELYKYCITGCDGQLHYKADPYGFECELRPGTASRIADISHFTWSDDTWIQDRLTFNESGRPVAIYEVHPGSWKKHPRGESGQFYTYREFAHSLVEYVKDMGYTHVELIGIAEYPFDGSWGYQVTGYFAPTSRYGKPDDFQYFVNYLHMHDIGVILDWVPAHFPKDEHGLADFDGSAVYEYADPKRGEHPEWGTKIFDYGRRQVSNFLIASALFWIEVYHVDGLRVDAVASMLYLDYGKEDGQWIPNIYGGNKNLEAVEFLRHLNAVIRDRAPGVMTIAEESTAWPHVTGSNEGLGFSLKWNMGWMHDFLEYMKLDPLFRKGAHHKLTFAMSYNYSEKYVLVLSHDEVVHLKCSMLEKMPGYEIDKFANLRVGYTYMFGHPGKKLLFMGQDFGQRREWSEKRELDWYLLADEKHKGLAAYVRELLHLYKKYPALYATDYDEDGFQWINADDGWRSIYSFVRMSPDGKSCLLFVLNFTPIIREDYRVGVPFKGQYRLLLHSGDKRYGGQYHMEGQIFDAAAGECDGREYSFAFPLCMYGAAVFLFGA